MTATSSVFRENILPLLILFEILLIEFPLFNPLFYTIADTF
jgi:hypothetical protein